MFKPTEEQEKIVEAARGSASLMINAYAGTGKTSTLQLLAPQASRDYALALAFNKSIATELSKRFPGNYKVQTLNALGFAALRRVLPQMELDARKLTRLAREMGLIGDEADEIKELTSLAMMRGIVPTEFGVEGLTEDSFEEWNDLGALPPTLEGIENAKELLARGIREGLKGVISFDDQIYLPLFFGGKFPRYGTVLIDESQDLSPLNHLQLARVAGGRIISVGDVRQAIYAWRGADAKSMENIKQLKPEWIELPLTTTFRCPKVIVARARAHAPGFNALASAPEGEVSDLGGKEWRWGQVEEIRAKLSQKSAGASSLAILCRNNAPLITMALRLLAQQIPAKVLGRDIGAQLSKLSKKLAPEDSCSSQELMRRILEWKETQVSISEANEDGRASGIEDRADSLIAIASSVRDAGELRRILAKIFDDEKSSGVLLSSIHKAKGREWDVVVHLDPHRCPSPWARSKEAKDQERNLLYVCETRTKHTLLELRLEDFR